MTQVVLVIGATGHQGGAVVEALLKTDFAVRAMVRDMGSEKAQALEKRGIEMVLGDLDDYRSLLRSMDGAYGAFSMLNFMDAGIQKEEERGKRVADAAKEAALQHFIYSSVGGADRNSGVPHFESKWRVEQHIRELGLPYSIVRPTTFMTNLMESPAGSRFMAFSMMRGGLGQRPIQMIAVQDIGKWVAHMLVNRDRFLGKAVEIAGDEVDFAKMMAAYRSVYGKTPVLAEAPSSPLPLGDFDRMFKWISTYGYKADLEMNRREIPDLLTYEQFVALKKPL